MQSNEMKKTNCLCDILPTPTFRVRHKTLRPCYTYAHERENNFFRPVNVYLFAFNHFSQFSSALTFHFQITKLIMLLLSYHSTWHSERISLQHSVVQQQEHLLQNSKLQMDFRFTQIQNLSCFCYHTTRYGTLRKSACNIG